MLGFVLVPNLCYGYYGSEKGNKRWTIEFLNSF